MNNQANYPETEDAQPKGYILPEDENEDPTDAEIEESNRPMDAAGNFIYRVPEGNLEGLTARIAKMNKRAAKLGMDPLVLTTIGEDFETLKKSTMDEETGRWINTEYQIRIVLVTLTGTCPRVNGWAMAATIQHEEGGNILRTVPGFTPDLVVCDGNADIKALPMTLPLKYRMAGTECEHCETNRKRNDTYVLFNRDTDAWKQVGRNCLADFLRSENAAGLAEWAELLAHLDDEISAFEEEGFGGGHSAGYFSAQNLLTQVACCIRADGWCSRTEAKNSFTPKTATVDSALWCMDSKLFAKLSAKDQAKLTPTEADAKRATEAIEWAQSLAVDTNSDYEWNIRVISHKEHIGHREAGLAGSIIAAYNRHMEQELAKKYERDHPSEWFGTKGERATFTLTVVGFKDIQSDFGSTTLVTFRTQNGDRCKWFASNATGFEQDKTYEVKATVKGHDEYKGSKQTLLTRCTIYDAAAEAQAKANSKVIKAVLKKRYTCKHDGPKYNIEVPELDQYAQYGQWTEVCCAECHAAWTARAGQEAAQAQETALDQEVAAIAAGQVAYA